MLKFGELFMIMDLHRQGLAVSEIARRCGLDRKTVRKYIRKGAEPPTYGPREPRPTKVGPFLPFLRERIVTFPGLSAQRLFREIRDLGYGGQYGAVKAALRELRPPRQVHFERRFETTAGQQAQVDFAHFRTRFETQPDLDSTVWLFTMVLGHSRFLWGRFFWHQDLVTVLRAHVMAFAALGGSPREILYDRMKTAVLNESQDGIIYNAKLQALARHYSFLPRACAAYRAKTKGKVERPYRYIRQDFFLGRTFRDLNDLNAQFFDWQSQIANRRRHRTTHRPIEQAFQSEQSSLQALPAIPFDTVVSLDRRLSRDGMISVNSNEYSVPDGVRGRAVEAQVSLSEVRIYADRTLVAAHPILEGRHERSLLDGHRRWASADRRSSTATTAAETILTLPGQVVARRPLAIYDHIGAVLASGGAR